VNLQYRITPSIDEAARKLSGDVRGARRAGMINLVTKVESVARKNAPVKRSNLANSGSSEVDPDGSKGTVTFSAPYAEYVHEGTGLYGPHRTKIVPKTAKALYWPGAVHPVRAVRGMKGRPFLLRAAQETDMEKVFAEGAENYLERQGGRS